MIAYFCHTLNCFCHALLQLHCRAIMLSTGRAPPASRLHDQNGQAVTFLGCSSARHCTRVYTVLAANYRHLQKLCVKISACYLVSRTSQQHCYDVTRKVLLSEGFSTTSQPDCGFEVSNRTIDARCSFHSAAHISDAYYHIILSKSPSPNWFKHTSVSARMSLISASIVPGQNCGTRSPRRTPHSNFQHCSDC